MGICEKTSSPIIITQGKGHVQTIRKCHLSNCYAQNECRQQMLVSMQRNGPHPLHSPRGRGPFFKNSTAQVKGSEPLYSE